MCLGSDRLPRNVAIYYVKPATLDHSGICKTKPQVEACRFSKKSAMVDLCGLNVVDGPFLWCGTKPVILGWDYFDYSLAALAIGLQK